MTPRVLERELEAARLRAIDDYKRDLTQAYNYARCYAMVRSKKGLPPLSKLLDEVKDGSKGDSRAQSPGEMLTAVQMMAAQYGIPLRRKKE
jgi:hypothetical protein